MLALHFFRSSDSKEFEYGPGPPSRPGPSLLHLGPPPAGRSDGLGDDPDELLGDGEVEAEAVLEHRRGGPGGGVGVGPGPTDAPIPNAVGVAWESLPSWPMAKPSPQVTSFPKTWSVPRMAGVDSSRRRSGVTSRTPSTWPSSAAYMLATARAVILPPAGMSAMRMSRRLPSSAFGQVAYGQARNIGESSGIEASISAPPGASSSWASRPSSAAGMPKYSSSATPNGPATSSRSTCEIGLPVVRRTISPTM